MDYYICQEFIKAKNIKILSKSGIKMTEILTFVGAMIVLYIILKIISIPVKIIVKLLVNAFLGGVILFLINLTGIIALDINWLTSLIVGFLGIPGVIIVIILHFLF